MFKKQSLWLTTILMIMLVAVSGCDGEGGGNNSGDGTDTTPTTPQINTGIIVDSAIIGLRYVSTSPTGETKKGVITPSKTGGLIVNRSKRSFKRA